MENLPLFYRLGQFVYKRRRLILFLGFAFIISCLSFLADLMTPFKTMGFVDTHSNSAKADLFLKENLSFGSQSLVIAYSSETIDKDNPLFLNAIKTSLSRLSEFHIPHEIIYPSENNKQFSSHKHEALVLILFKTKESMTKDDIHQFKALIKKPPFMRMALGGEAIFLDDINQQTKKDLYKADIIAAPVSIVILILVFRSLVAAIIPILLGGSAAVVILTSLYFLAHILSLSIFTINISLLLGLCLSLDYALFFLSRFREELQKQLPIEVILSTTMNSAGRAIFYSGIAVFISLSALLIFPVPILFSIGVGGLAAVFFSVCISLILLPAVLSVVQGGVNRLSLPSFKRQKPHRFWRSIAEKVVKRPLLFFFPSLLFLLFLSLPFLHAQFGISDAHILPKDSQSRQFLEVYKTYFNEYKLTPIILVAVSPNQSILSPNSLPSLYELTEQLKTNPAVSEVNSIVSVDKKIKKEAYFAFYNRNKNYPHKIKQLLDTTTGKGFTIINVVSKYPVNSPKTKQLVKELQKKTYYKNLILELTGIPVNNVEVMEKIGQLFPWALLWILVLTYLILLLLLHSLLLPIKALIMNIISLSASYGVLVFVFQEGFLQDVLHFVPQGMLDTSLLIIIFCALFGFSMDYEVFLLTRMKECYERTKDTRQSVISGIDQSGRIITSAAIIVIVLCGSFMAAEVLMVKEFGLGIAIAIFVDAFLVRSLLEPSLTVLLGKWNWYLPRWLSKILPRAYEVPDQNR